MFTANLRYFACLAAIGSISGFPASAAGPVPAPPEPIVMAPAQLTDWSGPYVGLTLGAAQGDGKAELGDTEGSLIELDVSNGLFPEDVDGSQTDFVGGVAIGYNMQRDTFVGGVEFDYSFLNQDIQNDFSKVDPGPIFPGVDTNTSYRTEISGLATLRARAGYASDRNLFFASAGLAAGHVENELTLDIPQIAYSSPDWSNSDTLYGYVIGAGYERRISDRVSLKGELLYYDLEDVTIEARDSTNFPGQGFDYEFENDGFIARVGISFAF